MGNFQKVSAGSGVLTVNSVDVGFLKGPGKAILNHEKLELRTGVPRKFQGALVTEMIHRLEFPIAQLDADTISKCSGFTPVTIVDGTPVTIADGANQERTFSDWSGQIQAIVLDGPAVENLVVKNQAESVTYTENDDYIIDTDNGIVFRNPGGAIALDEVVRVAYEYTPVASKRLNIGAAWAVLDLTNVKFEHTRPNGKKMTHFMHKAQATGNVEITYDTQAGDFIMTNFSVEAVDDTANNPGSPLGYWNDEQ